MTAERTRDGVDRRLASCYRSCYVRSRGGADHVVRKV
jgi:hypothetical protein